MSNMITMLDSIGCFFGPKGYDIVTQTRTSRADSHALSYLSGHIFSAPYPHHRRLHPPLSSAHHKISRCFSYTAHVSKGRLSLSSFVLGERGFQFSSRGHAMKDRFRIYAAVDVANGVDVINDLGMDTLTLLAVTVIIVPAFKIIKASPILGFFFAGVVLNQFGLIRNLTDVKVLSEWGILFLLFEMGLELSLARLKALAKFAFGMGLTQVVLCTLAFTAFELPPNGAIGTKILQFLFNSRPDLVNIRSIDEAVVIGAALSLSSSAFVLQLLAEKGELPTRFGSATLGILLLQDIAVVPLLVILPVLESQNLVGESMLPMLAKESLKALGGLGLLSLGGKYLLRRVFEVVAEARSSEAFVALCLLTVAGTSLLTQKLGFSDTLGAFLAGALLAETNFRTQIEADIRPFRGLLLGLFFVTTGTSIDTQLLFREWPNVLSLLAGLIVIKTLIITAIGPRVGLTLQESVRIGLLLSQGGEFGFVVFSLANRLGVLPLELNKLLIIVVVLSMALTPFLNDLGRTAADFIGEKFDVEEKTADTVNFDASEPVVILGFGQMGQVLANFLAAPLASGVDDVAGWPYVAFDNDLSVVKESRKLGFPVLYGDASRPAVLQSAGISSPRAIMVMYTGKKKIMEAVQRLRLAFPSIPIYARAQDLAHLLALKKAGATDAILENAETSLQLGSKLLKGLGVMSDDVTFLSNLVRNSMEIQAQEELDKTGDQEIEVMEPFQVRVADLIGTRLPPPTSDEKSSSMVNQIDKDRVPRFQGEVDQSLQNGELDQSEDLNGKGVLYCDLETQNGSPISREDAAEGKMELDPSGPLVINNDRP
ncbi:K(+) efflux antiporter 3, chloroplastic [Rhododendron vialii]|uniref:K(+) efflux antiporter 3, chloroplastic n=1 Tax=Rhododendron vialii TaxID=182163 RepID=UPI00265F384F|nr:K(+) efflux antiporter 3, chloroplastic [Rhododendron vialii]